VELPDHPWFLACQFHPEFKSKPYEPHPLFRSFIAAAVEYRRKRLEQLEAEDVSGESVDDLVEDTAAESSDETVAAVTGVAEAEQPLPEAEAGAEPEEELAETT
jgi:hypothetical protein